MGGYGQGGWGGVMSVCESGISVLMAGICILC